MTREDRLKPIEPPNQPMGGAMSITLTAGQEFE
jgi:hypothetical protein